MATVFMVSEIFHFCTIFLFISDFTFLIWLQTLLYIYSYIIDWILMNIIAIILDSKLCFIESKAILFSEDNNFLGGNDLIIEENEFLVLFTISCRFVHWSTNLTATDLQLLGFKYNQVHHLIRFFCKISITYSYIRPTKISTR